MLSDTLFEAVNGVCKDIARYRLDDEEFAEQNPDTDYEYLWYDEKWYDDVIEAMVPLLHLQICLDVGCDPDDVTPDRNYLVGRIFGMIVDEMNEILNPNEGETIDAMV